MKVAYNNIDDTDWEIDTVIGVQAMQRVQPANEDADSQSGSDEDSGIEAGTNGHASWGGGAGQARRMTPGLIGSLALGGVATWAGLNVFSLLSGGSAAQAAQPQTEPVEQHTQPPPPAESMAEMQPSILPMAPHTQRQRVSCRTSGFNQVAARGGGSSAAGACWSLDQMLQHASEDFTSHCFFAATRCATPYKTRSVPN